MFTATKNETEILKILNEQESLKTSQLIDEICKNATSFSPQQVENALEGCVIKGFVTQTGDGFFKLTEEGKKQV